MNPNQLGSRPHFGTRIAAFVVVILNLGLSACSGAQKCAMSPPADPRLKNLKTLRAEAKVTERGPEGRLKGTLWMMIERPDRLRIDVMSQFGPVLTLTSSNNEFALSDFRQHKFFRGPTCPRNLARITGIAMSKEAFIDVLMGSPPKLTENESKMFCIERDDIRPLVGANGGSLVNFPMTVKVTQPKQELEIRFRSVEPNVALPDDAFEQTPAAGLSEEAMYCDR